MNICLIGDGLISLTLAKALINNNVKVFMYCNNNKKIYGNNRTIGISSSNLNFFQKEIFKIKGKFFWEINRIKIYNQKNEKEKEKILDFSKKNKTLFSIIKNDDLYNLLNNSLKKNKNFKKIKINNSYFYKEIVNSEKYDLIINCEANNQISKKFFFKKIIKNYNSKAYVAILNHSKIQNYTASQIFTKFGPIAFLPISKNKTSIVFSIKDYSLNKINNLSQKEFEKIILQNNKKYVIKSINNFECFKLKSKILRNYYQKNILAFGEILHQIHPLSGQGFNMSLRDIKVLLDIIKDRNSYGLPIDFSICKDFENKTKHLNYIFSSGNDFIYEYFNHDNYYLKMFSKKIFNYLDKNVFLKKLAIKYADQGIMI